VMRPCGGGGVGDPAERDRSRIAEDIKLGYLTPEAAARDYGYSLKAAE
jgi:N-methylhydantoinase B